MRLLLLAVVCAVGLHMSWTRPPCDNPVYCYGDLLKAVQKSNIFSDSKTFVDRPLKATPDVILSAFAAFNLSLVTNVEQLRQFVYNWTLESNSDLLPWEPDDWVEKPSLIEVIEDPVLSEWAVALNREWQSLGRQVSSSVKEKPDQHSLLSIPHPFIIPGGRFGELYYWDTYWIVQGLLLCDMHQTAKNMVLNLAYLVDQYGMVPNGGRVYYTRRSQPPLLTQMIALVYNATGDRAFLTQVLPSAKTEWEFWMRERVVMVNGEHLNKYFTDSDGPRPESYKEDLNTVSTLPQGDFSSFYSQITSAAESGMDFSSRWLRDDHNLSSIHTHSIVPVDLNAILCSNEATLASLYRAIGNTTVAAMFEAAKEAREKSFDALFWNETEGLWFDWNLETNSHPIEFYASSLVPLFWGCSVNTAQHKRVLASLKERSLLTYPGGLPTSLQESGQQWDYPNVWPPHQWLPVVAWQQSHDHELQAVAASMAETWISSVYDGWKQFNHTMFEKYNCTMAGLPGGGGEYVIQAGFGWTNGVTLHFLSLFPTSTLDRSPAPVGWIAAVVLIVLLVLGAFPCALLLRWMYITGEKRYKARIQHSAAPDEGTISIETLDTLSSSEDRKLL